MMTRTGFTKAEAMQTVSVVVGIDVAKAYLDIVVRPSGEPLHVPGIGPVMSRTVLAELPELGALNRKQIGEVAT